MIFFDEATHTYRLDNPKTGDLCISGTTFIGLFKNYFNVELWSFYDGLRNCLHLEKKQFSRMLIIRYKFNFKLMKERTLEQNIDILTEIGWSEGITYDEIIDSQFLTKERWKAENDKSKEKGTRFHNHMENMVYERSGMEYEGVFTDLTTHVNDMTSLINPTRKVIAPELRMYNRKYKLSGTADMVFFYPDGRFDIDDWKTNKEIKTENMYDNMRGPISHLPDCNYIHYRLQVSLYAWILEQYGYKPNNLRFTHVVIDDNNNLTAPPKEYHTNYMKREIEAMLAYYEINKDELIAEYLENK